MRSKTFCFNKTIFKKNITRFWPIWALYLVILFFGMPVSLFLRTRADIWNIGNAGSEKLGSLLECIRFNLNPMFVFLFAILCAVAVFCYLYNAKSCNMIHAFPVRRDELFVTNYVSGLLFLAVPQVIAFLISLLVCIVNNVTSVEYLFYWLTYSIGMSFFFYSFAVFCCMLTGQYFAGFAYYILGNVVYAGFKYLITGIVSILCYGLSDSAAVSNLMRTGELCLSPIVFLERHVRLTWAYENVYGETAPATIPDSSVVMSGGTAIALYCIPAAGMVLLSLLLYRKRHLECAGDIVSFGWMKPIFRWLVAFCVGSGLTILFDHLFFEGQQLMEAVLFIAMIPFSCACFFLAEMLLQKKFRVFGKWRWLEWGVCAGAALLLFGAVNGDAFSLERKVPQADEIRCVEFSCGYDAVTDKPGEISGIVDIHRRLVEKKKEYEKYCFEEETEAESVSYVTICYYLKNGGKLSRTYRIPSDMDTIGQADSPAAAIRDFQKQADSYLRYLICDNYESVVYHGGSFYTVDPDTGEETEISLTAAQAQTLYEAVLEDILCGNLPYGIMQNARGDEGMYDGTIALEGRTSGVVKDIYELLPDTGQQDPGYLWEEPARGSDAYATFELYDTCEHTIRALTELGLIGDRSELLYLKDFYAMDAQ